jgi:exonuclease III
MKICSWNVRGLGGFEKQKEVRKLIGDTKSFIVCLQETKRGGV